MLNEKPVLFTGEATVVAVRIYMVKLWVAGVSTQM